VTGRDLKQFFAKTTKQPISLAKMSDPTDCQSDSSQAKYKVSMSWAFLLTSFSLSAIGSFLLGRHASNFLMPQQQIQKKATGVLELLPFDGLPPPALTAARRLPDSTSFFSKHYRTKWEGSESFLASSTPTEHGATEDQRGQRHFESATANKTRIFSAMEITPDSKIQRSSSESQIVEAMKELVGDSNLSYHCHTVSSRGISCVGISVQGHIVLHTFPNHISLHVYGIDLETDTTNNITGKDRSVTSMPTRDRWSTSQHSQSSSKAEHIASAFVHPAMLVQEKPNRIVVVGGSSSTVQQILLHNSVGRVILLDTYRTIEANYSYPCGRVEYSSKAAKEWFQWSSNNSVDTIFLQSPNEGSLELLSDMRRVLKDDGALVVQTRASSKWTWVNELTKDGDVFDLIKEYQEREHVFLLAFITEKVSGRWFASEAEVNLAIRERLATPLPYFDGAVMSSYQYPSRSAEDAFCQENPDAFTCVEGHGLDPFRDLVPISSFEVKLSTIQNAGRGVYVTHDVEEGAYIFVDGCVHNIHIPDSAFHIIDEFVEGGYTNTSLPKWKTLMRYTSGYGFIAEDFGPMAHDVDPGLGTFVNHGCNGTTNVGNALYENLTEFTELQSFAIPDERTSYNPAFDRSLRIFGCAESIALRKIRRGEEIFNNYMTFENHFELPEYAESLRNECAGREYGEVSQYEISVQGQQLAQPPFIDGSTSNDKCFHCRDMPTIS
jgi:spermidine synthase